MKREILRRFLSNYGMILVLAGLCVFFSLRTLQRESGEGREAATRLAEAIAEEVEGGREVLVVGKGKAKSGEFAGFLVEVLGDRVQVHEVVGEPRDLKLKLDELKASGADLAVIAATGEAAKWRLLYQLEGKYPEFSNVEIRLPEAGMRSVFLKPSNLMGVVERVVIIAIVAIGMTMVIITGGIDLSVGSLVALSAVIGAVFIESMGGREAATWAVLAGFAIATLGCGLIGAFCGSMVAKFSVAPFIVTLGVMMVARGSARQMTGGTSIDRLPEVYTWIGQGKILGIPNTLLLIVILYGAAHVLMSHTRLGRYIYAVGGNQEAARLSGVPVRWVLVFVYTVCGLLAGFGGCVQGSLVKAASPNMANMFELDVIAAVVIGGTSLSGGSGKIGATLIGACIIGVMLNGMNLLSISSYVQMTILGAVIIASVLLDKAREKGGFKALLNS